ncbi:hypothetical protein PM082_002384 [Marasmius tenuissimus]|nr:hypothetical protein PM082_002384 [Marasmius tenuissimus]
MIPSTTRDKAGRLEAEADSSAWNNAFAVIDMFDEEDWGGPSTTASQDEGSFTLPAGDLSARDSLDWQAWDNKESDYVSRYVVHHSPSKTRLGRRRKRRDSNQAPPKRQRAAGPVMQEGEFMRNGMEGAGFGWEPLQQQPVDGEDEHMSHDHSIDDEADLEAYIEEYQGERAGFIRVGTYIYVVQGWNSTKKEVMEKWFHFEARRIGEDVRIACACPKGIASG